MSYLLAGTGRSDITPPPGTPQGGWGAQTHERGLAADMSLYATALVLSDSQCQAAIIDFDCTGFADSAWMDETFSSVSRLTGIRTENIRLSYTHTHSGPNVYRLDVISQGRDMVVKYLEELPYRIAGAVWQAQQDMRPVRFAAGAGLCEMNVNRRLKLPDGRIVVGKNSGGPVDHTVRVVRFDDLDEGPVATIVHYACHPTIMGWQTQYFTPDYPGVVRQVVEREVGGKCLFLQGAAGNVGPILGFTGDLKVYKRLGGWLGLEASKVALRIETRPRRESLVGVQPSGAPIALYRAEFEEIDRPTLRVCTRAIELPLKRFRPLAELEAELAEKLRARDRLRAAGKGEEEIRLATALATQAADRVQDARICEGKTYLTWPLQGMRFGPIALLSMPGEPFAELNHRIVASSPFAHTLFSGYSNGGFGYLPPREAFAEGGFEVETSPFAPEAGEKLVDESLSMLTELAAG